VGVGDIGRVAYGSGWEAEVVTWAAPGGARPDVKIGSDDPVRRDAAVAAAATLNMLMSNATGRNS
jgi:hypothetical protein